jgi:hypothetical protein
MQVLHPTSNARFLHNSLPNACGPITRAFCLLELVPLKKARWSDPPSITARIASNGRNFFSDTDLFHGVRHAP